MKIVIMKWLLTIVLVLISWSLVMAFQAIHVPDPEDEQPMNNNNNNQSNTTFFLSVIPVQEPIRDDTAPPTPSNSPTSWNDKSDPATIATTTGHVQPAATESNSYQEVEEEDDDGGGGRREGDQFSGLVVNNQQRPKSFMVLSNGHDGGRGAEMSKQELPVRTFNQRDESHSSTLRSITASSSSLISDNDNNNEDGGHLQTMVMLHQRHHRHHHPQRESEFQQRGKEFVASPQLGQWSDEHDFKRLLTANDNVFYPIRGPQLPPPPPQQSSPASIKSTSFIGSTGGADGGDSSADYEKSKFINELPGPKFHSSGNGGGGGGNHLQTSLLNKHYPKFNDFVQSNGGGGGSGPIEIPHYVHRGSTGGQLGDVKKPIRFPGNHRTAHFEATIAHGDIRVQPLHSTSPTVVNSGGDGGGGGRHSGHRSMGNYLNSAQPDHHPYTFDFGHDESPTAFSKGDKPLDFYDLNEYEKFPPGGGGAGGVGVEQHHHHYHLPPQQHLHHGPRHGPNHLKKIVHVLAAAIPLGLVISALTPHVVYVNPNDTAIDVLKQPLGHLKKPFGRPPPPPHPAFLTYYPRWRALMENTENSKENLTLTDDFLTQLSNSLSDIQGADLCEDRAFCQMARLGAAPNAPPSHKLLWTIANETAEGQIRKPGMRPIFRAIREGHCEKIKCKKKT